MRHQKRAGVGRHGEGTAKRGPLVITN
jgi:hypothetical protein